MKTLLFPAEILEDRIAPAALASLVIVTPTTATYTDVDGDKVTVKVSTGTLMAGLFDGAAGAGGDQLQLLNLSAVGFTNANVTFTVVKVAQGDGLAAVGRIDGTGNALGKVTVKGDLGDIDTNALASLTARSIGRYDGATQGDAPSFDSEILGDLGALVLTNDLKGVHIDVDGNIKSISVGGSIVGGTGTDADLGEISSGGNMGTVKIVGDLRGSASSENSGSIRATGAITSITVGGSLLGNLADGTGAITSGGNIGTLKVTHNMQGGAGEGSGSVLCGGALTSATIGGSVTGGQPEGTGTASGSGLISASDTLGTLVIGLTLKGGGGLDSGSVEVGGSIKSITVKGSVLGGSATDSGSVESFSGLVGTVKIGHDLIGGTGANSGNVDLSGDTTNVSVGGSVFGGTSDRSGVIFSTGNLGVVSITHDLRGGSISTGTLTKSGYIGGNRIGTVTIGGSLLAGVNDGDDTAQLVQNASIQAVQDIASITVKGSIVGTVGDGQQVTKVLITASGQLNATPTVNLAIVKLTVGGEVELAQIIAGCDTGLSPADADAQIGAVSVKGDWIASDLVASAKDDDVTPDGFGNANDTRLGVGTSIAKIASITIGGIVMGTTGGGDHFGFVAPAIGSLKVNGATVPIVNATALSMLTGSDVGIRLV